MSTFDEQLRAIRERITDTQRAHARATVQRDVARATVEKLTAALVEEFGVADIAAGYARLGELRQQLADEVRSITVALDEIGA